MKPKVYKGGFVNAIISSQNNSCFDFITCTSDSHITLWKLSKTNHYTLSILALHKFQAEGPVTHLVASDNIIGFTLDRAVFLCKVIVQTNGEVNISKITHSNDQSHVTSVTELSACSSIPLFASASKDGKVKIWDASCMLIRELCFDESLSGMCFCNDRGDLLVGFQKNLHYISVMEYLPQTYLEILLQQNIEDDKIEYCILFDPNLKFWYDSHRVPAVAKLNQNLTFFAKLKEMNAKLKHQKLTTTHQKSVLNQIMYKNNPSMIGFKQTPEKNAKPTLLGKIRKYKDNRFSEKIRSNKPIQKPQTITFERSLSITYEELYTINFEEPKALTFEDKNITITNEISLSERYGWPFAPDCFIPNSIVRSLRKPTYPFIDHLAVVSESLPKQNLLTEIDFENNFEFSDIDSDYDITDKKIFSFSSGIKEHKSGAEKQDGVFGEKRKSRDGTFASETEKAKQNTKTVFDYSEEKRPKKILNKRIPKNKNGNQNIKTETESVPLANSVPLPQIEIESIRIIEHVLPPFDEYINKEWFPRDIGFDQDLVILYLINQLNTFKPLAFKEILSAITKIHSYYSMSNELFENYIQKLLSYLDDPSGQIRHYAVSAFLALSPNRRDVLLKLIPKLNDPIDPVKDAVKIILQEMAGIKDADTLASVLRGLGEMKANTMTTDKEVLESFKDTIITNKESFRKLSKIYFSSNNIQVGSHVSANLTDPSVYENNALSNKSLQSDSMTITQSDENKVELKKTVIEVLKSQEPLPLLLLLPKHKSKISNNGIILKNSLSNTSQNYLEVPNNDLATKDYKYSDFDGITIGDVQSKFTKESESEAKNKVKQKSASKEVIKKQGNINIEKPSTTKGSKQTIKIGKLSQNIAINWPQDIPIKRTDKITPIDVSIPKKAHKEFELGHRVLPDNSICVKRLGPHREEKIRLSELLGLFKDDNIWHLNKLLHENTQETTDHLASKLANRLYKKFEALKSNPASIPKPLEYDFLKTLQIESNDEWRTTLDVDFLKSQNTSSDSYKGQDENLVADKAKNGNKKTLLKSLEISNTQVNKFGTQINKPENNLFCEVFDPPRGSTNFSFEKNKSDDETCSFNEAVCNLDNLENEPKQQHLFKNVAPSIRVKEKKSVNQIKSPYKVLSSIEKENEITNQTPFLIKEMQNRTDENKLVSQILFKSKNDKTVLPEFFPQQLLPTSRSNSFYKLNSCEKNQKTLLASSSSDNKSLIGEQKSENKIDDHSADNISMLLKLLRKAHSVQKKEHPLMKLKYQERLLNIKNKTAKSQNILFTLVEAEQMLRKLNSLKNFTYKIIQSGVRGERVLCRLEMIPSNYTYETITKIINSLPERYGCQIVSVDSGITKYGSLSLYWKSICNTDLSQEYR